jgi:peptide/nickel transport system substrate-binding protein
MLSSAGSYANLATGHATLDAGTVQRLDGMLRQGLETDVPDERKAAYTEAQRYFAEEFMAISMVVHTQNIVAASADLGRIRPEALSCQRMQLGEAGFAA